MDAFQVYSLFDIQIVKGNGCYVFDDKGNRYLDLYGGHAVIQIGHSHPHYIEKITEQLNRLAFYSNSVINGIQQEFIKKLEKQCGYPDYSVFLINSGAEAIENALKLASFHTGRKKYWLSSAPFMVEHRPPFRSATSTRSNLLSIRPTM